MTGLLDRRSFLQITGLAGAGLMLGVSATAEVIESGTLSPDAFLQVDESGTVTIWIPRQEMGQGVRTALAMLVAEELDARWNSVRVVQASLDERYGPQRTGGSLSVRELWEPLRTTGARARRMLLETAAERWNVPLARLRTHESEVIDDSRSRRLEYAELAAAASKRPVPASVVLKDPSKFTLIGTDVPRVDDPDIVTGRARYGIDVRRPGMLYATFQRSPVIGGKVREVDASAAKKTPGVRAVIPLDATGHSWMLQWSSGVAVVADSTWAALQGREALQIDWDEGPHAGWTQERILGELATLASRKGTVTREEGELPLSADLQVVESDYLAPYLSQSPLEPMNCVADVREDACDVWAPCQFPNIVQSIVARVTGLAPERVRVHPTMMGGGFGRRIYADYAGEAALLSKETGRPVQLLFTRSDDTKHGFYRPISHHRMRGWLDRSGVVGWQHRISGPSRDAVSGPGVETPERSEVYAAVEMPYAVPNVRVEFNHLYVPIPCGPWRSVAYSQTGFVIESFIDELAHAAGADPIEFRLAALTREPFTNRDTLVEPARMRRVLEMVRQHAGGKPRSDPRTRRGRGVAVTCDHGTAVAHVADVSVSRDGALRVDRFVSLIDCGTVVHPSSVRAQVEGSIVMGLSATIGGEITIDRGRIAESSYLDNPILRIDQMPRVEVHIVPSAKPPGGVGEPPLPGVAPAVTNAIFAATGKRIRRLPLRPAELAQS